jgi:hypothetical protein
MKYEEIGEHLDEEFTHWAMDQNGFVCSFKTEPIIEKDYWMSRFISDCSEIPFQITEKPENWQTSLRTKINTKTQTKRLSGELPANS